MAKRTQQSLQEFDREMDRIEDETERALVEAYQELIGDTYDDVLKRSDPFIRTGTYRLRHHITQGAGQVVYEREDIPEGAVIAPRPSVPAARAALAARVQRLQPLQIRNDVHYASFLEFGTSRMAPKAVYRNAGRAAQNRAPRPLRLRTRVV